MQKEMKRLNLSKKKTDKIRHITELYDQFDELLKNKYVIQNMTKNIEITEEDIKNDYKTIDKIIKKILPNEDDTTRFDKINIYHTPKENKNPSSFINFGMIFSLTNG